MNLFLIGYVLATFNFGAQQAFVTQLFYGLILVCSLLLTLLVPVIGRYIWFISPYAAFVVLGCVVAGSCCTSAPAETYLAAPAADAVAPAVSGDLATRFLLLPPAGGVGWTGLAPSPLQQAVLALVVVLGTSPSSPAWWWPRRCPYRVGLFLYVFVGSLILLLLLLAGQGHAVRV